MAELEVKEHCGLTVAHSLNDAHAMISQLQHRGREATGFVAKGDGVIDAIKWVGPVSKFDLVDLAEIFPSTRYHTFMAHVRYATMGRKEPHQILQDAHPHTIGGKIIDKESHVIMRDCDLAIVHNGQVNDEFFSKIDKSKLKTGCDTEAILHLMSQAGLNEIGIMRQIPGSYTLAIADKTARDVIVMRDRHGMMPGMIGKKDGKYVIASEDIAFRKNHVETEDDLLPGSIYYLTPEGGLLKKTIMLPTPNYCMFQYNYVADKDSVINGVSVSALRRTLGIALAKEINGNFDYVTYLPRCPKVAAISCAAELQVPFIGVFYKMRAERSFQGPTPEERKNSISKNLHINDGVEDLIRGKNILLVDDSTVRGNNANHAINLLKKAGVANVTLANYTSKIGIIGSDGMPRGCNYGIDMSPSSEDFIARNRSEDQINDAIGAQTKFLSLEAMLDSFRKVGISEKKLCYFCVGGPKPF